MERLFIPTFGNYDLSITAISTKCRKYRPFGKGIDTFVHTWFRKQNVNRQCIQLTVVDENADGLVPLRDELQ